MIYSIDTLYILYSHINFNLNFNSNLNLNINVNILPIANSFLICFSFPFKRTGTPF